MNGRPGILSCLPKNNSDADRPSADLGQFLNAEYAFSQFVLSLWHFFRRVFTCFTAFSARPFDLGLYGDEVSLMILLSAHHFFNSVLYCHGLAGPT